jgi:hypothetical protein
MSVSQNGERLVPICYRVTGRPETVLCMVALEIGAVGSGQRTRGICPESALVNAGSVVSDARRATRRRGTRD